LRTLGWLDHERAAQKAATAYCDAALLGDPEAAVNLAQLERVAGRKTVALEMLRSAARQGSVIAAAALMTDFSLPLGEVDDALDGAGLEALGALLLRTGHWDDAQRAFEEASAAGRLHASAQLGGLLLERDPDRAIKVLEPTAARGSRAAARYLGRALAERAPERARRLLQRADEFGPEAS
jgi:TPR repeat protein